MIKGKYWKVLTDEGRLVDPPEIQVGYEDCVDINHQAPFTDECDAMSATKKLQDRHDFRCLRLVLVDVYMENH